MVFQAIFKFGNEHIVNILGKNFVKPLQYNGADIADTKGVLKKIVIGGEIVFHAVQNQPIGLKEHFHDVVYGMNAFFNIYFVRHSVIFFFPGSLY